eukprot:296720-Pelagomonas_calceolata.AAC.2
MTWIACQGIHHWPFRDHLQELHQFLTRMQPQNFKLNLMVDMLALNLAEKEYPQGKGASTVGLLSRPAPKLGMAV